MQIIKYQLATEINRGTPDDPDIEISLAAVSMPYTEANYQLAMAEAYQGKVTVEDVPETADEIRAKRDKLLDATDWAVLPDSPLDEPSQTAMKAYRQALRDVPQQVGFPNSVSWPNMPEITK